MVKDIWHDAVVCIVGLNYLGLPLAEVFSKSLTVIGFDTDTNKVNHLTKTQSEPPRAQMAQNNYIPF